MDFVIKNQWKVNFVLNGNMLLIFFSNSFCGKIYNICVEMITAEKKFSISHFFTIISFLSIEIYIILEIWQFEVKKNTKAIVDNAELNASLEKLLEKNP